MSILFRTSLVSALVCSFGGSICLGENWPQWRGPRLNGVSEEKELPAKWSTTENVIWKVALPGPAGSTPAIWEDKIFLTSADDDDLLLICLDLSGKELWKKNLGSGNRLARGDEGNFASPSPCTDGKHVITFVGSGDLACFDFEGNQIWHKDLQKVYGTFNIQFGMTSTPVLDGDSLYLQLIHGEGDPVTREALVVCLNKATGKEIWKTGRESEAYAENEHSYASPIIYRDKARAYLLTHGADYLVAHDLKTGKELWRSGGLHRPDRYDPTLRLVASPVCIPGLIVVPSAKGGRVLGLSPTGEGNVTESKDVRLWTFSTTPDVPSPMIHDGLVYLCREIGAVICLDAKTGEEIYQKRIYDDRYRASPVLADGKIYLTARNGLITVIKAGKEFEVLSENKMEEAMSASPAISNGRIYLRTFDHLWAIGSK